MMQEKWPEEPEKNLLLPPPEASRCRWRASVLPTIFFFFFKLLPLSCDNGCTDRNADYCVKAVVNKKLLRLKLVELWSRDVTMVTNFVARNGDKSSFLALIVCAGIWKRLGRSQNLYIHTETPGEPSTSLSKFVNFSLVNHWDIDVSLQVVGGHAKIRTFSLFPPECLILSSPNFQKI